MPLVKIDPEIMGGTPCFNGTRVPVDYLFNTLERGESLDAFLDGFPSVAREHALAVLEAAKDHMIATALRVDAA